MTAIYIIAHAPLASALLELAGHVHGAIPDGLGALDVAPDADPDRALEQARVELQQLSGGGDALLLTDMAGATPANLAQRLLDQPQPGQQLRLLAGLNLPMLLRSLSYRERALAQLVELALAGGQRGLTELAPASASTPPEPPCRNANC